MGEKKGKGGLCLQPLQRTGGENVREKTFDWGGGGGGVRRLTPANKGVRNYYLF